MSKPESLLKPIDPRRLQGSKNRDVEAFVLEQCDRAAIGELINMWKILSNGTGMEFAVVRQFCAQRIEKIMNQTGGSDIVEDADIKRWINRYSKLMTKYAETRGVMRAINSAGRVCGETYKNLLSSRRLPFDNVLDSEQMKIRDVIRLIEADGWRSVRQTGSHRQFKHPRKKGLVTVAGKPGVDVPAGTLKSILKQAGLEK